MAGKIVVCDKCSKQILYWDDFNITQHGLSPFNFKKYHNACYAEIRKTSAAVFDLSRQPLNASPAKYLVVPVSIGLFVGGIVLSMMAIGRTDAPSFQVVGSIFAFAIIIFGISLIYGWTRMRYYEKALPSKTG